MELTELRWQSSQLRGKGDTRIGISAPDIAQVDMERPSRWRPRGWAWVYLLNDITFLALVVCSTPILMRRKGFNGVRDDAR